MCGHVPGGSWGKDQSKVIPAGPFLIAGIIWFGLINIEAKLTVFLDRRREGGLKSHSFWPCIDLVDTGVRQLG
jgi:hypothetical protein